MWNDCNWEQLFSRMHIDKIMYRDSGNHVPLHTFHTVFFLHTPNDRHNNNDDNKDHQYDGCNNRHHNGNYGENTQFRNITINFTLTVHVKRKYEE